LENIFEKMFRYGNLRLRVSSSSSRLMCRIGGIKN